MKFENAKVMPNDRTDSFIRRIVDIAFNQGNFSALEELVAPGGATHIPAWGLPNNRMGLKQFIAGFRTAFPDLHCTIEDEIQQGNKSSARCKIRGTHTGTFLGNPPTGRSILIQGMIFAQAENGQIIGT